jgi:hypothetical protein
VSFRLFCLAVERVALPFDLLEHIAHPQEVVLRGLEAAERSIPLDLVRHGASRLLEKGAPVGRSCAEERTDGPLLDQGVRFPPQPAIEEKAGNIFQAAELLVQEILALAGAVEAAGDGHFVVRDRQSALDVGEGQGDFRHADRFAVGVPGEDQVFHPVAAERFGALLSQHPADGINDIRLPAAVGSHEDRQSRLEVDRQAVDKGFEAEQRQVLQEHTLSAGPTSRRRPPPGQVGGSITMKAFTSAFARDMSGGAPGTPGRLT